MDTSHLFSQLADATEAALKEVFGGPEKGVVAELLFSLEQGTLASQYDWPAIVHYELEFPVPRGRVDLMLFHEDGSGTVVECKPGRSAKDVLPAIGQVMAYAVQVGYSRSLTKVRMAIATRASGAELRSIRSVLRACNIEPMFCGQFARWANEFAHEQLAKRAEPLIG